MRLIQWATALFATGAAAQAYSRTAREVSALSDKNATVVPNSYILEVKSVRLSSGPLLDETVSH